MVDIIRATQNTCLKKDYQIQANLLTGDRKVNVPEGKTYQVSLIEERGAETEMDGHFQVDIAHGAGTWYVFCEHG